MADNTRYYLSVFDRDEEMWECVNEEFDSLEDVQDEINQLAQVPRYIISVVKGEKLIVASRIQHTVLE